MTSVIILAAGIGSRLLPLTAECPKCMVKVGGHSLIERLLSQVRSFSPESEILVVVGYKSSLLSDFIHQLNVDAEVIVNSDFLTTNNMESCRLALDVASPGDCVIVNADCMYDDVIVQCMLTQEESCIAVDSNHFSEESMKVKVADDAVVRISKQLSESTDVKTSIDMYYFTEPDKLALHRIMRDYSEEGDLNQWTEVAIDRLVGDATIVPKEFSGSRWVEIDNLADLEFARELFS